MRIAYSSCHEALVKISRYLKTIRMTLAFFSSKNSCAEICISDRIIRYCNLVLEVHIRPSRIAYRIAQYCTKVWCFPLLLACLVYALFPVLFLRLVGTYVILAKARTKECLSGIGYKPNSFSVKNFYRLLLTSYGGLFRSFKKSFPSLFLNSNAT